MKKKLLIEGMSWGSCVRRVRVALESIEGIKVEDIKIGEAIIAEPESISEEVINDAVYDAVYDAGYDVTEISEI